MRPKALGNDMVGPNVTDTVDSHLHNVVYKATSSKKSKYYLELSSP